MTEPVASGVGAAPAQVQPSLPPAAGSSQPPGRSVTVVLPAALRDEAAGASSVTVVVAGPARVRDVLDALAAAHPRLERRLRDDRGEVRRHVNVFVAGDDTKALLGQDTPVPEGAEVVVLPNIAGG